MSTDSSRLALYETMVRIRAFEEEAERLVRTAEIDGNLHLSTGQEAVAAGVSDALGARDYITTTHRGHGHCVAKGGDPERMFAELYGHSDGYCKGRAGSMHIADPGSGILGATAIVGGTFGMAVGGAFSAQFLNEDRVSVAFFGEGAAGEGSFHEALNLAALWDLPLIFCCENNQYAELTPVSDHLSGEIIDVARAHGVESARVDGNDVEAVRDVARELIERARRGEGPSLLECVTYRWSGHYVGDPEAYRPEDEVESWKEKDPIARYRSVLEATMESGELDAIDGGIREEIAAAATRASTGERASVESIFEDIYAGAG